MKFDINKAFLPQEIASFRAKEKTLKSLLFLFALIVASVSSFFIFKSTLIDTDNVLESFCITLGMSVFLFYISLGFFIVLTANMHKLSFKKFQYIQKEKCTDLLEITQVNPEIKNYVIQVSEQGRQVTKYEYEQFDLYLKRESKRITDERHQANCNKLYNELSGN